LIGFDLTPGQRGDIRVADALLSRLPKPDYLLGDTAYDGDQLRLFLAQRGTTAVIKPNPTRKHLPAFDKAIYKLRNLVERAFSHLKDWRRVATRYDKLARNFVATVALAAIIIWWA
jgi:transposase